MLRFLLFASILVFASPANAENKGSRFCVVPIKNGQPTKDDVNATWRMVNTQVPMPNYPYPIFTPLNRRGVWTIDSNREWLEFKGHSPKGFLDKIKEEPWSGRTIIVRMHGDEDKVLSLGKGSTEFKIIDRVGINSRTIIEGKNLKSFSGPYILESRKETLVESGGLPYLVSDTKLVPWSDTENLKQLGITNIFSIYDAPALDGIIILTRDWDLYLYSEGHAQNLIQFSDEVYGRLINLHNLNTAVFLLQKSVFLLRKNDQNQMVTVQKLNETKARGAGKNYRYLAQYDQLIRYNPDLKKFKYRWEVLTPNGFETISNDSANIEGEPNDIEVMGMITDVPTMGLTIYKDSHNISLYDGKNFVEVQKSYKDILKGFVSIVALPSIKRILVLSSESGVYEILQEGGIRKIEFDIGVTGLPSPQFIDWPSSHAALMITTDGVYSMDHELNATKIDGGKGVTPQFSNAFVSFIPALGDVLLKTQEGLVSVVDSHASQERVSCEQLYGGN